QLIPFAIVDEISLASCRKDGIFPPDLPDLGVNPLTVWNLHVPQEGGRQASTPQGTGSQISSMTGVWSMVATRNGNRLEMRCSFRGDDTFTFGSDQKKPFMEGRYSYSDRDLAL